MGRVCLILWCVGVMWVTGLAHGGQAASSDSVAVGDSLLQTTNDESPDKEVSVDYATSTNITTGDGSVNSPIAVHDQVLQRFSAEIRVSTILTIGEGCRNETVASPAEGRDGNERLNLVQQRLNEYLFREAKRGRRNQVRTLLRAGAHTETMDKDNNTALIMATTGGDIEMVKLLLKYGANINTYNKDHVAPLHIAAGKNFTDIVEVLLKYSPDIDILTLFNTTPLLYAACAGNTKVIELLLESGADPKKSDMFGMSPIDCARMEKHPDVVTLMEKWLGGRT